MKRLQFAKAEAPTGLFNISERLKRTGKSSGFVTGMVLARARLSPIRKAELRVSSLGLPDLYGILRRSWIPVKKVS